MTSKTITIFLLSLALAGLIPGAAGAQESGQTAADDSAWTKPQAALQAEVGIDSLQRRFFQPRFSFDWPLA
ncbi:MAG: hypothetical protein ABSA30_07905, partial [Candidatus Aminicenantales bacterium]